MLKIKDDVDLNKLQDFGFKPKYDVNTGEKEIYIKTIIDNEMKSCQITVEAKEFWIDECDFFHPNKRNKFYKLIHIKGELTFEVGKKLMDSLYDLTQAGLVEKVEDNK